MPILHVWHELLVSFERQSLRQFLLNVLQVSWQTYQIVFYYFWWVIIILLAYQFRWFSAFGFPVAYEQALMYGVGEFVNVFESGFFFLILSYVWVMATQRSLPRVVDYFIRLLYFYIPYAALQVAARYVEEHVFSLGVVASMGSFIGLVVFTFFLMDTYDGIRVPFFAAVRTLKMLWYTIPLIVLVILLGAGLESLLLSLLRYSVPAWDHAFVQKVLFMVAFPLPASFFAVFYAQQTMRYPKRYAIRGEI